MTRRGKGRPVTDKRRVRGTKRITFEGQTFDSKREFERWRQLVLLEKAGEIVSLERQYQIPLMGRDGAIKTPTGRTMRYIADFRYIDLRTGLWVIEDAKGHPTDTYLLKKAILEAMNIKIREV
jgi:hypothetical protein